MRQSLEIYGSVIGGVGHGNKWSHDRAIAQITRPGDIVNQRYAPITSRIARPIHQLLRKNERVNKLYTNRSENLRQNMPLVQTLGVLSWIENFGTNQELYKQPKRPRVLLATQEIALWPFSLMPELLLKWFPDPHRYLLIPDPIPKQSTIKVLEDLGNLFTPITYTQSGIEAFKQAGIKAILVSPWLTQEYHVTQPSVPQVVYKSSGSGASKTEISAITTYWQTHYPHHELTLSLPDKIIHQHQGERRVERLRSLYHAYAPLFDDRTNVVISPASEVLGLAADRQRHGYTLTHLTSSQAGQHEAVNYCWATTHGVTTYLNKADPLKTRANLHHELGTLSLREFFSNL